MYLGNLTIDQLEKRSGWTFSDEDRKWLIDHRQDTAEVKFDSDKFHIFDIPLSIVCSEGIVHKVLDILKKYNDIQLCKEDIQIQCVKETEDEKERRLKKEQAEKERQDRLNNPNSIWLVKYHMLVPVVAENIDTKLYTFYWCFINVRIKGHSNIPNKVNGYGHIEKDEEGLHGTFVLDEPDLDYLDDDSPYVIGIGLCKSNGELTDLKDTTFERTEFSINECIDNFIEIKRDSKEIHFDKIQGE